MTNVAKIKPDTKDATVSPLALLREPFPAHQISKLPKESKAQADQRKADRNAGINCKVCGGWHHKNAVHLDYVGHAAATDRLLDADPRWTWDPVPDPASLGLPTAPGGMWIKLTVDGVSRYGFGSADGKSGGDAIKEIIGDAIRNAGMRFGMALDLWHKGDLHAAEEGEEPAKDAPKPQGNAPAEPRRAAVVVAAESAIIMCETQADLKAWSKANKAMLDAIDVDDDYNAIIRFWKSRWAALEPKAPADDMAAAVSDLEFA